MIQPIVLYSKHANALLNPTNEVDLETEKEQASNVTIDLLDTLEFVGGLGLAANQLGIPKSICVVTLNADKDKTNQKVIPMVNPKIVWHSEEQDDSVEGCLSLPDITLTVKRWKDIRVQYVDPRTWETNEIEISFPNSVVIQHEIDHLNGKLIIDDISNWDRDRIKNKLKRISRGNMPINYVGMTWNKATRNWVAVGSRQALAHLERYRMQTMLAALMKEKQEAMSKGESNESNEQQIEGEEAVSSQENETGEVREHEVEQNIEQS